MAILRTEIMCHFRRCPGHWYARSMFSFRRGRKLSHPSSRETSSSVRRVGCPRFGICRCQVPSAARRTEIKTLAVASGVPT